MSDKTKRGQIIKDITGQIAAGTLGPGDKLPGERDMAVAYGYHRQTVHTALRELATRGVLVRRRKAGTFVTEAALEQRISDVMYQEMQQRAEAAEADAARWRVIAGYLEFEWDESASAGGFWSWIAMKVEGVSVSIDPADRHLTLEQAVDRLINKEAPCAS